MVIEFGVLSSLFELCLKIHYLDIWNKALLVQGRRRNLTSIGYEKELMLGSYFDSLSLLVGRQIET